MSQKIKLLWATIRMDMFRENHAEWMKNAKDVSKIQTYVAVNNEEQKSILLEYDESLDIVVIGDQNFGVAKPLYEITKNLQGQPNDIIVATFDDVHSFPDWDVFLYDCFKDHDGAIYLNDGVQSPDNHKDYLITIPCMTFSCLEKINKIIFHPVYDHFFGDDEFTGILRDLKVLKDCRGYDKPAFRHFHSSNRLRPQDDVDARNYSRLEFDRAKFWIRTGYTLEEKLQLNIVPYK
jgi:hypothetical protein